MEAALERLQSLTDAIHGLIARLEEPNPDEWSEAEIAELRDSVSPEIKSLLAEADSVLETAQWELDSLIDGYALSKEEKVKQMVAIDKATGIVKGLRIRYRKAQLRSKIVQETASQLERRRMYCKPEDSGSSGEESDNINDSKSIPLGNRSVDEQMVDKSEKITQSLKRSRALLQLQLTQSDLNISELEDSQKSLRTLGENYLRFDDIVAGSAKLVAHVRQSDAKDRLMMLSCLGFLAVVVMWIVWRRVLRGPVRLLLWTLWRVFGIFRWLGGGAGLAGDGEKAAGPDPPAELSSASVTESVLETAISAVLTAVSDQSIGSALTAVAETLHDEL